MAEKKYLRAKTGFMLPGPVIVKAGQIVASTDKVVEGREELFEPMEDYIETATRAPGEKRLTPPRHGDTVVLSAAKRRRARRADTTPAATSTPTDGTGDGGDADAKTGA